VIRSDNAVGYASCLNAEWLYQGTRFPWLSV
jgi:hypothetical protein